MTTNEQTCPFKSPTGAIPSASSSWKLNTKTVSNPTCQTQHGSHFFSLVPELHNLGLAGRMGKSPADCPEANSDVFLLLCSRNTDSVWVSMVLLRRRFTERTERLFQTSTVPCWFSTALIMKTTESWLQSCWREESEVLEESSLHFYNHSNCIFI